MRPDLRTPVMTLVDLSWQDAAGALHTARARMEDKSVGGACLRVNAPFLIGAKLRIQWRFEQFSGSVRYCRSDGHDYLLGIQRDSGSASIPQPLAEKPSSQPAGSVALPLANLPLANLPLNEVRKSDSRTIETPKSLRRTREKPAPTGELRSPSQRWETRANHIPPGPPAGIISKLVSKPRTSALPAPRFAVSRVTESLEQLPPMAQLQSGGDAPPRAQPSPKITSAPTGGGMERKTMTSKWLKFAVWRKQNHRVVDSKVTANPDITKENSMTHESSPKENNKNAAREVPAFQVELLPVEDVYHSAGILNPHRGYSAVKVVEMLQSQHIRGLSPEMKRAAVLLALDAAGVTLGQIQHDAKLRQDALDAYELAQKKQAEVEWARKAEETVLIRAELESLKAHYTARIERGLETVARDKSRFSDWSTKKELEAKTMAEAIALCMKPAVAESTSSENKSSEEADAPVPLASAAAAGGSGSD